MSLGLRNNSATWLMRFRFKSSVMDTWYLVSLVTYLNWPGVFENFLASSSLQQFQLKSSGKTCELKWISLWQATSKYLEKQNHVCSPHVSIKTAMEQSLIMTWSVDMNIETIEISGSAILEILTKEVVRFDQLRHWQNTDVNERLLTDYF